MAIPVSLLPDDWEVIEIATTQCPANSCFPPKQSMIDAGTDTSEEAQLLQQNLDNAFYCLRYSAKIIVTFLVEIVRFILGSLVTPLVTGIIAALGDLILRPVFSSLYTFVAQPTLILLGGILTGLQRVLQPLAAMLAAILDPIGRLLRSVRLVEVRQSRSDSESVVANKIHNV